MKRIFLSLFLLSITTTVSAAGDIGGFKTFRGLRPIMTKDAFLENGFKLKKVKGTNGEFYRRVKEQLNVEGVEVESIHYSFNNNDQFNGYSIRAVGLDKFEMLREAVKSTFLKGSVRIETEENDDKTTLRAQCGGQACSQGTMFLSYNKETDEVALDVSFYWRTIQPNKYKAEDFR